MPPSPPEASDKGVDAALAPASPAEDSADGHEGASKQRQVL